MTREEYIVRACDELKSIVRNQSGETVEITSGEDRLGEISAKGTEDYPILVGAIAAYYINPNDRPNHIYPDSNYSEDRWERMVHRALMEVIQRLQRNRADEDEPRSSEESIDEVDISPVLAGFADAADDLDQQDNSDRPFIDPSDDTIVDIFEESLEEMTGNLDETEYDIYFPLNIRETKQASFLVDGTEIRRVDNSIVDQIFESNDLDDISILDTPLEDFLSEFDLHPTSYNNDWYWSCSIEAPSSKEAISTAENIINIAIGKLNYTIYYESDLLSETTLDQLLSSTLLDEEVIVERPPFMLVCEDDNLVASTSRLDDFGNPVDLDERFRTTYSDLGFRKFPPSYARVSERTLASGLQGFFSAVSATNPRESFFAYWRGLEDISFTDPSEDESVDILKRTGEFCSIEDLEVLYNRLKQTRNSLVHSGGSPSIPARDTIILREIFIDAFPDIWEIEDSTMENDTEMRYILQYIISNSGIEHTRETLDEEIEKSRSQIEEYERKKTALGAIEDWQEPN
jgi:hypothetical protein